jgi:hypothetical protein
MKKFLQLAVLSSISLLSNAQWQNNGNNNNWDDEIRNNRNWNNSSAFSILAFGRNNYQVVIDNSTVPLQQTNNGFLINGMPINAGNHSIAIYENRNILFGGNTQRLIYSSNINFAANTEVLLTIQSDGNILVNSRQLQNGNGNNGNNYPYGKRKKKNKRNGCDNDNRGGWNNGGNWNNGGGWGSNRNLINDGDFDNLKVAIGKQNFDDRKLLMAKQASDGYLFTVEQVKALVNNLSFDNNKLDLAKHMYTKTADNRNYYLVADVLSFGSSKDDLLNFIKR